MPLHHQYLYTGAMIQDLTVDQHSTWNGLALNHLYSDCPASFQAINQIIFGTTTHHALHCICLVSESTILYFFLTAHVSLPEP